MKKSKEKKEEKEKNAPESKKISKFSLRVRLTFLVLVEIVGAIVLAFIIDAIFNKLILKNVEGEIPIEVEVLAISLLVCFFITNFILSRIFFDPIKKLGEGMDKVAHGDFSVQLKTKSTAKEINNVYYGFNLMVKELNATEILQTDFVSNVSHELKTPINAIEGYAMLLQGGGNLDEQQKEYVDKIIFNTQRLSSLTQSILLLSKIENQAIPTNQTRFSLDEQIRQSIVALEPSWEKKDIDFDVELDSVEYFGNEILMRHVWDNLISNAIKFNAKGGFIKIRLSKHLARIVFTIDDRGPGISEEAQNHIFDKFYQADNSHKQEGNGLGLPLVKKILTLEGGEVSVENLEVGCRFTVILKIKPKLF